MSNKTILAVALFALAATLLLVAALLTERKQAFQISDVFVSLGFGSMRRSLAAVLALATVVAAGCRQQRIEPEPMVDDVRLLLVVVVDQLAFDTIERVRPALTGGLAELLESGISFTDAHHRHAVTSTAPGHAALMSGLHPRRSGIVGNHWFDRDREEWVYCVDDAVDGTSPRQLLGTTIADWIVDADWRSKAYSASGKDRAAVLSGGHSADAAFWYVREDGEFESSSYYRRGDARWLEEFNEREAAAEHFGHPWTPLPSTERATTEAPRRLGVVEVDEGVFADDFPHPLGSPSATPDASFYRAVYGSPFVDEHLARFARALADGGGLGEDDHLDLLALSFSAVDTVGHDYGPRSREVLDTVLRLDRELGALLEDLRRRIGADRIVVALSADHGVMPLPEAESPTGRTLDRLDAADVACVQAAHAAVVERFGERDLLAADFHLDGDAVEAAGIEPAEVEETIARALSRCRSVARTWRASDLRGERPPNERLGELYWNAYFPGRSPDVFVQWRRDHLARLGRGTTHASPYPYDTHVPLVLSIPGAVAGTVDDRVATVDLAPTLASLLGVPYPSDLDGRDLTPVLVERELVNRPAAP